MKFKSEQTYDKLRGGYYTPAPVARFLARWALADGARSLLEPSCGDGAFFRAVRELGTVPPLVHGVELDAAEAAKADEVLAGLPGEHRVFPMDFLTFAETGSIRYEAAVGNPPYIRYQFLSDETQRLARVLYERHGLPFTKHLNAWAPFVVDSIDRLAPGGRLAMIIPAELMNVIHAGGLRLFLLEQCARVHVIDTQTLIFDSALQGTVLLLAVKRREGQDGPGELAITHETGTDFLDGDPAVLFESGRFVAREPSADKWMDSLLTAEEQEALERVTALPAVRRFGDIARVGVGIVTGANKFFLVPDSVVQEYDLQEFARPMFGRSFHCKGVVYGADHHEANRAQGVATNFLHFGPVPYDHLPPRAQKYIQWGEEQGLHTRYKCRIREPWYDVPSVRSSALSLLKRSYEAPRLIVNELGAYTTDTAYRVDSELDAASMAFGFFNSLTSLSAEMSGRTYGGGVLELVPSEVRKLLVPVIEADGAELRELDRWFQEGVEVDAIMERQDERVLGRAGLAPRDIEVVQGARRRLMARRMREVTHE